MLWKCCPADAASVLCWSSGSCSVHGRDLSQSGFKKTPNVGAGCSPAAFGRDCWSWERSEHGKGFPGRSALPGEGKGRAGQGSWVMLCDLWEPGRAQCWEWCRGALAAGVFGWIYLSVFLSQGAIPSLPSLRWDTKLGWGTWKHVVLHPM